MIFYPIHYISVSPYEISVLGNYLSMKQSLYLQAYLFHNHQVSRVMLVFL